MGPRVKLPDNITMEPQQVDDLTLALPPDAKEIHVFQNNKITLYYRLVSYMVVDANKFRTKTCFKSWIVKKNYS